MVTEPTSEAPVVAPVEPPVAPPPSEPSPEVKDAPQPETGEPPESPDEAPPVVERTWGTILEEVQENEGWRTDYDTHITDIKREEQSVTQKKLQPLLEQADATARENLRQHQSALQSGATVLKKLMEIEKGGTFADGELTQVLTNELAPFVAVMTGQTGLKGWYDGLNWAMFHGGEHLENPEVAQSHRERLKTAQDAGQPEEFRKAILRDWLDETLKGEREKAEEKGYRRGLKESTKAAVKVAVADKRAGAGPDGAGGGTGGETKPYAQLQPDQRAALRKDGGVDQYTQKHG